MQIAPRFGTDRGFHKSGSRGQVARWCPDIGVAGSLAMAGQISCPSPGRSQRPLTGVPIEVAEWC